MSPSRREFLRMMVHAGAALPLASHAFSQQDAEPIIATNLADNVFLVTGAGSNVVAVSGPDGLLVVDGGVAERSADLLRVLHEHSGVTRIQTLFNTHWHHDHAGLNATLGKAGTKIVSHENTKLWLGEEVWVEWQNRTYKPLPAEALPGQTFYTSGKMKFGDQDIEYGLLPMAHTDGDIYVYLRKANVLVAGDVVSVGSYPVLDYTSGGWIGGLADATKTLAGLANAETRIVPGTGDVRKKAHLDAQLAMCTEMRTRLVKLMKQGMGPRDMIAAAPSKDFDGEWGNADLFISNAYRGMWGHVRELGGIV